MNIFDTCGEIDDELIPFVQKGWGWERVIANGIYCLKELVFCRGRRASYHYHKVKTETFLLAYGRVEVLWAPPDWLPVPERDYDAVCEYERTARTVLTPGGVFHIPPFMRHQVIALEDSKIIEASTRDFPDDSYRLIKGD